MADEEMEIEAKDNEVAPSPFEDVGEIRTMEYRHDEEEHDEWRGAIVEMDGKVELHPIHMRLVEIVPFLNDAIAKSEGHVKSFLQGLKAHL